MDVILLERGAEMLAHQRKRVLANIIFPPMEASHGQKHTVSEVVLGLLHSSRVDVSHNVVNVVVPKRCFHNVACDSRA